MTEKDQELDRRSFVTGALGAAAGIGVSALLAPTRTRSKRPPAGAPPAGGPPPDAIPVSMRRPATSYKLEADVRHCDVEGKIPADLNGAFYRVGPDPQYPLNPRNIPFDGEGHVGMFRIKNGRVDYKSRFVRNDRWLAQDRAGRALFPMYRNPSMDDPSVKGLSPEHGEYAHHQSPQLSCLR